MKEVLKKASLLLLTLVSGLLVFAMPGSNANAATNGFYVSGTTVYDGKGNPFVMRGINVAHAWFTSQTDESIKAVANTKSNVVRVVVADGAKYTKTTKQELIHIVDECKKNNLVCILEVHDATGSDNEADLNKAVNYWLEMKDVLVGNEQYVILNIANEWYGSWNGAAWAEGYKKAIPTLRNANIHNLIMVDCAGWGQYPICIKEYGKSVFDTDKEKNTMFSIHMYEYAGGSASVVKQNIDNSLNIGVPVVIGEFAAEHTNGDVDEATIMNYCTQKNVGYLGWSWKGNNQDLASLDIAREWNGSSLTSWGNTLINGTNGIKNTSIPCSVFNKNAQPGGQTGTVTPSQTNDKYVSLFYGSAKASNWGQAVSVDTKKIGGKFDAANIKQGGHFYVEYTGKKDALELIFQSFSGGSSWGKVSRTYSGTINGHYFATYSYDNCVKALGSNDFVNKLDKIHVGATNDYVEILSVCYDFGNNTNVTTQAKPDEYVSLFWGKAYADSWKQAATIKTAKNKGSFDSAKIKSNGYFYVEYEGTENKQEFVLQSWTNGSKWAKVKASETGKANGHFYAKYSYDNCVKAFGTNDFSKYLDAIHIGAGENSQTFYTLCYCYKK